MWSRSPAETNIHGDVFDFLRNTLLMRAASLILHDQPFSRINLVEPSEGRSRRIRFSSSPTTKGSERSKVVETGIVSVPSLANRAGDFSDSANTLTGKVNGAFLAQTLASRLGYGVAVGEPFYTPGCGSNSQCVFPGARIPQTALAVPASKMLQFIPTPNFGANEFSTDADKLRLNDDKGSARIDINSEKYGTFSVYYFADSYNLDNPYPSGFGGATLPGPNGAL